jgi:hypothetical protein
MKKYKIDFQKEFKEELTKEVTPYIAFVKVISGRCFDKKTISKWFKKLIPTDDYSKNEQKELIEWLVKFSSTEI